VDAARVRGGEVTEVGPGAGPAAAADIPVLAGAAAPRETFPVAELLEDRRCVPDLHERLFPDISHPDGHEDAGLEITGGLDAAV